MALPAYGIDEFNFEFWQGPAPYRVHEHGRVFTKPGSDNIATQITGVFGDPFEVTLTSWWGTYADADFAHGAFAQLIYSGAKNLKYNNLNYSSAYALYYHVLNVIPVRVSSHVSGRRAGVGGVLFTPLYVNVSRWTLQPEYIEPEAP